MIKSVGSTEPANFDESNIPVNISLTEIDERDEQYSGGYRFWLTADVYSPWSASISEFALEVYSDNRYELQKIVLDHMFPLYKNAMAKLNGILEGTNNSLYYWDGESSLD